MNEFQAFRCTSSIRLCTDTLRTGSRLELHVHVCIQTGYHADNPPWGLSPGCNRTQFTRTHTSEVSHRRDHATARTHPHAPQGRQLATISLKHVTGSLPAPASGSGSQGARPFAATASVPFAATASKPWHWHWPMGAEPAAPASTAHGT
jgi:hypothetical protein